MRIRSVIFAWLLGAIGVCTVIDLPIFAQDTVPNGTIIPVVLQTSIDSQKSRPGQQVLARVAQDVPLGNKHLIHYRSKVVGEITQVQSSAGATNVGLRFVRVEVDHHQLAIISRLRAIASFMVINEARRPTSAPNSWFNSPESWTTVQIGGDEVVYRGGGPVESNTGEVVGKPVSGGGVQGNAVLVNAKNIPGSSCIGAATDRPQALWLFSSDACGIYGFTGLQFDNPSTTSHSGEIVFSSQNKIELPSGTALLLTTTGIQINGK